MLAIGIVVDDAIVVVEAVQHHIEHGLAPREATIKAMSQVSGPVIAVGLVLSAVFVPCAFITGITGQFFRQFALTIAISTLISAFNSLTLSPALSALLLRPREQEEAAHEVLPRLAFPLLGGWLGYELLGPWLARLLEAGLPAGWQERCRLVRQPVGLPVARAGRRGGVAGSCGRGDLGIGAGWLLSRRSTASSTGPSAPSTAASTIARDVYGRLVGMSLRVSVLVLVVYGGLLVLTWWGFTHTPTGFIPAQDKGYLLVNVQLPDAASRGADRPRSCAASRRSPPTARASSTPWPSPASRSCWVPTPRTSAPCT